jgi:4-hydroxy-tetrahydrodipicolinate synthase
VARPVHARDPRRGPVETLLDTIQPYPTFSEGVFYALQELDAAALVVLATMLGSVLTAMVTPFTRDGSVDFDRFRELATSPRRQRLRRLVVCGTTGESPTLSDAEKLDLFAAARESVGDRATVIAGTGTYDTAHSVHLTQQAAKLGVDGILVVTPYYNKPPQRAIVRHFEEIAGRYAPAGRRVQHPGRVVVNIEPITIARLAEIENVVAVKQAHDDLDEARFIAEETRLDLYSGDDPITLAFLELGAVGVVSVTAHLWGTQIAEMIRALRRRRRRGRTRAARGACSRRTTSCGSRRTRSDQGGAQPHGPRGRRATGCRWSSRRRDELAQIRSCLERSGAPSPRDALLSVDGRLPDHSRSAASARSART